MGGCGLYSPGLGRKQMSRCYKQWTVHMASMKCGKCLD